MEIGSMRFDYGENETPEEPNNPIKAFLTSLWFPFILIVIALVVTATIAINKSDEETAEALNGWIYINVLEHNPNAEVTSEYVGSFTHGFDDRSVFAVTIQYKNFDGTTSQHETRYVLIPNKDPMEKKILSFKKSGGYVPYANR